MTDSMSDLLKQAQKMQFELSKKQKEISAIEVTGSSGAGLVSIIMNGRYNVNRIDIDKSILVEQKEVLEDLLAAAINDAVKKVEENNQSAMSGLADNLKALSGIKLPF